MVEIDPQADRIHTAKVVLNLGLAAAFLPAILAAGALILLSAGAIDWWTAYGRVLIGDGASLPFALQAVAAASLASAAGLAVAWWAGAERFYSRAMLNVTLTGISLGALVLMRG